MQTEDEQNTADAAFAARALSLLAEEPVSPDLEARIFDDFVRTAARPKPTSGLARALKVIGDTLWPGAPLWQPASILALSLIVGLAAGLLVPSTALTSASSDTTYQIAPSVSLETPPSLDLSGKEV